MNATVSPHNKMDNNINLDHFDAWYPDDPVPYAVYERNINTTYDDLYTRRDSKHLHTNFLKVGSMLPLTRSGDKIIQMLLHEEVITNEANGQPITSDRTQYEAFKECAEYEMSQVFRKQDWGHTAQAVYEETISNRRKIDVLSLYYAVAPRDNEDENILIGMLASDLNSNEIFARRVRTFPQLRVGRPKERKTPWGEFHCQSVIAANTISIRGLSLFKKPKETREN